MPYKDYVFQGLKIEHKGVFDLKELYNTMYDWLKRKGYAWAEKEYKDSQSAPGSRQIEIEWEATKAIDDYVQFVLAINFMFIVQDVDVEKEGIKVKAQSGMASIKISAIILKDYAGKWEKPISGLLREFYDKYIIRGRIESLEKDLYGEGTDLINEVKSFLNLHTY